MAKFVKSYVKEKKATPDTPGRFSYGQRSMKKEDQEFNYFHQPVIEFPISQENKEDLKDRVNEMFWRMGDDKVVVGIGLAGNQPPQKNNEQNPYAIFVIGMNHKDESKKVPFEAFVNADLVGHSTEKTKFPHGCLSALEYPHGDIATYSEILVAYYTPELVLKVQKLDKMAAIIAQHEMYHLMKCGTYVDRAEEYFNGDQERLKQYYFNSNYRPPENITQATESESESDDDNVEKFQGEERDNELKAKFKVHTVDEIPLLITPDILSRCKNYLQKNKLYSDAVDEYLNKHPEDRPLYENLMKNEDTDLPLYGLVSQESALS